MKSSRLAELVASLTTLKRANEELEYMTGVARFLNSKEELAEFQHLITLPNGKLNSHQTREFGELLQPSLAL